MPIFTSSLSKEIKKYRELIAKTPNNPRYYSVLGDLLHRSNKIDDAIESYRQALDFYIVEGYPLKAVAVAKIMLNIAPKITNLPEVLMNLYDQLGLCGDAASTQEKYEIKKGPACLLKPPESPETITDVNIDSSQPASADDAATSNIFDKQFEDALGESFENSFTVLEADSSGAEILLTPDLSKFFSEFSDKEFIDLMKVIRYRKFSDGDFIYQQGEKGDSLYFLVSGQARVTHEIPDGNSELLNILVEEDIFGEAGFLINANRTSSIQTTQDTEVLEISRADADKIFSQHRQVEEIFDNFFQERIIDMALTTAPIFSKLSEGEREKFIKKFDLQFYSEGSMILSDADLKEHLYIIREGTADILEDFALQEQVFTTLKQGDFIGAISSIKELPAQYKIIARTDCEVLEISRDDLKRLFMESPRLAKLLQKNKKTL